MPKAVELVQQQCSQYTVPAVPAPTVDVYHASSLQVPEQNFKLFGEHVVGHRSTFWHPYVEQRYFAPNVLGSRRRCHSVFDGLGNVLHV